MTYAMPLAIPVLTTNHLSLRPPREADFPAVLAFNDSPRADYHARIAAHPPVSCIDVANTRSLALAERLGARRETTRDDEKGQYHVYRHPAPRGNA